MCSVARGTFLSAAPNQCSYWDASSDDALPLQIHRSSDSYCRRRPLPPASCGPWSPSACRRDCHRVRHGRDNAPHCDDRSPRSCSAHCHRAGQCLSRCWPRPLPVWQQRRQQQRALSLAAKRSWPRAASAASPLCADAGDADRDGDSWWWWCRCHSYRWTCDAGWSGVAVAGCSAAAAAVDAVAAAGVEVAAVADAVAAVWIVAVAAIVADAAVDAIAAEAPLIGSPIGQANCPMWS